MKSLAQASRGGHKQKAEVEAEDETINGACFSHFRYDARIFSPGLRIQMRKERREAKARTRVRKQR